VYIICNIIRELGRMSHQPSGRALSIISTQYFSLWRPLLPYGYSYKASCARPG